jgi:hypothetical protein
MFFWQSLYVVVNLCTQHAHKNGQCHLYLCHFAEVTDLVFVRGGAAATKASKVKAAAAAGVPKSAATAPAAATTAMPVTASSAFIKGGKVREPATHTSPWIAECKT